MQRKIGVYIRVSTEEQASAIEGSLDNQKYRLQAFVDLKNTQEKRWGQIIEYYIDDGFSAKDTRRPAFQRMIGDIKKKRIELILITDISRLSRNIADFCLILSELEQHHAQFLSIKEQFDTTTPVGKMMIYNMINLAQFEREQISERVSLGVHARAMRGLLNGARPMLGYDKVADKPGTFVINDAEAEDVRMIFRHFLNSGSKPKTIQELECLGIKPKLSGKYERMKVLPYWTGNTLGTLLSSAAYIGKLEVNKSNKDKPQHTLRPHQLYKLVEASWPGIVDENDFWEAQRLLEEAQKLERVRLEGSESRFFILSGALRCGECGAPLVGASAHGAVNIHRYYQHTHASQKNGCAIQRVGAEEVEAAVIKYLWDATKDAGYLEQIEAKVRANKNVRSLDVGREKRRLKDAIADAQLKIDNVLLIRGQSSASAESKKFVMETFESLSREKAGLNERLTRLNEEADLGEVVVESRELIRERLNEFKKGFAKAKGSMKKRLIRQILKQVVLGEKGLTMFMNLADGSDIPNHQLQLAKERSPKKNDSEVIYLTRKASSHDTKPSIHGSSNDWVGDPTPTRTGINRLGNERSILLSYRVLISLYPHCRPTSRSRDSNAGP